MKGFVLFLVVVLLAYTYAAPQGAANYANVQAHSGSTASGVVSGSTFGNGAFSAGGPRRICGLFEALFKGC
ncbi:hypothetical protein B5X24_HaOG209428 [Helicoverpa armigera]|uniref:Uncharacterized protein n=1 Tax=Helicoverpa armigera TaxID=29058 RepID=A0A2W1BLG4_HELAM|nr:hypothetical protein B5X24_HaOG209428 [Helicoverpa armigera]